MEIKLDKDMVLGSILVVSGTLSTAAGKMFVDEGLNEMRNKNQALTDSPIEIEAPLTTD